MRNARTTKRYVLVPRTEGAGPVKQRYSLARIGGDDFAFVGPGPADLDEANRIAAEIRARFARAGSGTSLPGRHPVGAFGLSIGAVAVRFVSADQGREDRLLVTRSSSDLRIDAVGVVRTGSDVEASASGEKDAASLLSACAAP